MNDGMLHVGVDAHERELQLVVMQKEGSLLLEERIRTIDLSRSLSSFPERSG